MAEKKSRSELMRTARAVASKIKCQFPDTTNGRLMFGIVDQAITDLFYIEHRPSAIVYLSGPIEAAAVAGVDPAWIHRLLKQAGLLDVAGASALHETAQRRLRQSVLERRVC